MSGYYANVIGENLARIVLGDCALKPARQSLVPAQVVSPHALARQVGKPHQAVCASEIELIRTGPQGGPLHGVFTYQYPGLRSHQICIAIG